MSDASATVDLNVTLVNLHPRSIEMSLWSTRDLGGAEPIAALSSSRCGRCNRLLFVDTLDAPLKVPLLFLLSKL